MILGVPAHAKLNLNLEVLGRRPDGHHEIRTLMQAISLHDLQLAKPSSATRLTVHVDAPAGSDNLVLRAAAALEQAAGRALPAEFGLLKRIPPGSGMGGGSSNAAAALRALARLYDVDLDLRTIAAALGADVPFFLRGGAVLATGRGDELHPQPRVAGWFAVAWPGWTVSTSEVYARWREAPSGPPNALVAAATAVEPRLADFADTLGSGWQLTGTGSAFFRRCATAADASEACRRLECWTAVAQAIGPWA